MARNIEKNKNWLDRQKKRVSQEHLGPLILEKSQMYILTIVNLLYTVCYEIKQIGKFLDATATYVQCSFC